MTHSTDRGERLADGGAVRPRVDWRADWRVEVDAGMDAANGIRRGAPGMLGLALIALGLGVVAGALALGLTGSSALAATPLLAACAAVVALALARWRPPGLLRARPIDLLWAVGFGPAAFLLAGYVAQADAGGAPPLPTLRDADGALAPLWWASGVALPLVAAVVSELFFRGVVLVAVFVSLRRLAGAPAAGFAALVAASVLSVGIDALGFGGGFGGDQLVGSAAVAITGSLLVLLTGRIWGAVGVNVVFAALGVALALAGSL